MIIIWWFLRFLIRIRVFVFFVWILKLRMLLLVLAIWFWGTLTRFLLSFVLNFCTLIHFCPHFTFFIWVFLCSRAFYYLNFCYNEVYVFKLFIQLLSFLYMLFYQLSNLFKLIRKVYNSVADFKDKKWSTSHAEQSSKHINLDRFLLHTHSVLLVIRKNPHQIFSIWNLKPKEPLNFHKIKTFTDSRQDKKAKVLTTTDKKKWRFT